MVRSNAQQQDELIVEDIINIPEEIIKWCSVSLSDVVTHNNRLEASVFDIEGKNARELLNNSKWDVVNLWSEDGLIDEAKYPSRFKRIYVDRENGVPFFLPSQLTLLNPNPTKFISEKTEVDINTLKVRKGELLLTRSGTIGNVTIVSDTLEGKVFSDDVIRVTFHDEIDLGFTYAFLCSKIGNKLLQTNTYGAVISHIEPEHLANVPVPNPPALIKSEVHHIVKESFKLRDESNKLIKNAEDLLIRELKLPPINDLHQKSEIRAFSPKLSELNERFDASYHLPLVSAILEHLKIHAKEITSIGDVRISKNIVLAGVFKRVYVNEGNGVPFLGGRDILQLSPKIEKFLSIKHHKDRIEKELKVEENMILITDRGTIGNVVFVPKHFEDWTVSQNVIKIKTSYEELAGYTFIFLNSEYGKALIKRHTYGSVVDMIDDNNVAKIEIPLLKNKDIQEQINSLALEANKKRYEAYLLEQNAIKIINDKVIQVNG
ncbi:restriction endonuclease subunit S [Virgibacillus salarius]